MKLELDEKTLDIIERGLELAEANTYGSEGRDALRDALAALRDQRVPCWYAVERNPNSREFPWQIVNHDKVRMAQVVELTEARELAHRLNGEQHVVGGPDMVSVDDALDWCCTYQLEGNRGFPCTRMSGHDGPHVCGDRFTVRAAWI